MLDFVKIGVRTAIIASLIAAVAGIYALFSSVQIPTANLDLIVQGIGIAKAFGNHWIPELMWAISAIIALFFIRWTIFFIHWGVVGIRWVLQIWQ